MLDINLKYIRENFSELEDIISRTDEATDLLCKTARNGSLTLVHKQDDKTNSIHSRYDPTSEAVDFINSIEINKSTIPIIVGFGLGYHIEILLERFADFDHIFIIEPRFDVLKCALDHKDLSAILKQKNISIISARKGEFIIQGLNEIINNPRFHKRTKLIVHQASLDLYQQSHPQLTELIKRMNVEPKIQSMMKENFGKNLSFSIHSTGIKNLFDKLTNKPIILISAGPSLSKDLDTLKKIQKNAFLISVSTPLKLLLENDIRPDIITIGDPKQIMESHFEGNFDCDIPLLFLPTISHSLLKKYNGPKIVALQNEYKLCDMLNEKIYKGRVDVGESVATLSLDAAIKFGASPIIFVGQDLAFSDGHSHADGVDKRLEVKAQNKMVENVQGKMVATSMSLSWFKDWIEKRIAKDPDRTYINVSQTGARIRGTEEMSLEEAAQKFCQIDLDKSPLYSLFEQTK